MPSTRRTAKPGTTAAVLEDLRAIREDGGVSRASDDAFVSIVSMLAPGQPLTEDSRLMAANLVLTHVRRIATEARQLAGNEPCQLAAAESFETILSRAADDVQKVASIRRAAKSKHKCHLTIDGLRKREDTLLARLATVVHADLIAVREKRGPQTVEEIARYIYDDVRDAWESLDDGLKKLYQAHPMTDQHGKNALILTISYDVAHMQYWAGRMIGVRMRPQQQSSVDFMLGDAAGLIMASALPLHEDKKTVNELLTKVGRHNQQAFLQDLANHPDGPDIISRFTDWICGCHLQCAYQRTYNVGLLCSAHQFTFALFALVDLHEELVSGELEEGFKLELNQ